MASYDKLNPYGGVHRMKLAAAWDAADVGKPYACGTDNTGKLVKGKGNLLTPRYLFILDKPLKAGTWVDAISYGEVSDFGPTAGVPGSDFGVAGTDYFGHPTTGAISSTASDGCAYVGSTIGIDILVVHVRPHALAVDVP